MVVEGVDRSLRFVVERPAEPTSRNFDEGDSASKAETSPLAVELFAKGGLSIVCFSGSVWSFFALMGLPLEKVMGKRVRLGCCLLAAGLDPAPVYSLLMGLH